ncbi:MAG: galactose mutarotase [Verrucomicrobia bacterium]|nr:galactose mutarotase [Verrucomicrobiota bacterium]MCH8527837.1 galactose mutarotase [Kiritimatiellia bacterium]
MSITLKPYGSLPSGEVIQQATLEHAGLTCRIITYGGIITELWVPDREGHPADVVLGLPSLEAYLAGHPYLCAIVGRVAGRINGGSFTLDGKHYQLARTQPPNHLHGGETGLDKRVWTPATGETEKGEPVLSLHYVSPDGEEGYPGTVDITVRYTLTSGAGLRIDYEATTDAPTPFSPTNHAYFNLAGEGHPTIADHVLQIFTGRVVWKDEEGSLDTKISSVEGTRHDFRTPKTLREFIAEPGLHGENYILRGRNAPLPERVAVVTEPTSGRKMEVFTTTTSLQFYSSHFLDEAGLIGKTGTPYLKNCALCLECQGFPNGVNRPEIDDIILRPGTPYRQTTEYRFS